jgi:hypothetical protein
VKLPVDSARNASFLQARPLTAYLVKREAKKQTDSPD